MEKIAITECPRDAMQGIVDFIPTEKKIQYLNLLLKVGFDRLDFGSFVSPRAIPQMRDTAEVLAGLTLDENPQTKLLAIIANERGARDAAEHEAISFLGFPFSVSETFQLRNTNQSIAQATDTVLRILEVCDRSDKTPLVYLSMGFGNPYGDPWSAEIVAGYAEKLIGEGVKHLALADTIGNSSEQSITSLYSFLSSTFDQVEWGLHLHSTPADAVNKIRAGLAANCRRFDTAIRGFGGCPMAKDELTGNIPTETLLAQIEATGLSSHLNEKAWADAMTYSWEIFR
ncbi:MAG TPA: hydroxymethylglutaryl-CoA lyase [Sphingobacteriaceae bacterium]|nr:hydroxymethylglutaryl-CoA lyase [Sphingobacteriaceae bacterium]